MSVRIVYQTLQDRNNNTEILKNGPFVCRSENAWLTEGYYFWEDFIEPAHYWGNTWHKKKYIITKGECLILPEDLFDLTGNTKHMRELMEVLTYLHKKGLATENTTVPHVIDFLRKTNAFPYYATRVTTTDSFKKYPVQNIKFEQSRSFMMSLMPAIQICIYDLELVLFENYSIVYPEN